MFSRRNSPDDEFERNCLGEFAQILCEDGLLEPEMNKIKVVRAPAGEMNFSKMKFV